MRSARVAVKRSVWSLMLCVTAPPCPIKVSSNIKRRSERRFIDPVAMRRNRVDRLAGGFREPVIEVIGMVADRGDRLLCRGVEALLQRFGLAGESQHCLMAPGHQLLAHLIGVARQCAESLAQHQSQPLLQTARMGR